ncbi:MAG: Unknown protein [uncultured Sulfurovum sp.]|uniref:Uncharacterized protein n=1 Tax=uncultured Sulfurovum sp. TaxID=269237 RepID=A0A6S6S9Z5_9BACT|nr:MAG: Unknown protein [uncultured Sulfurovum sp.]
MRKVFLLLVLSSWLLSNSLFDLSGIYNDEIAYSTKAKMKIRNNGKITFNLPIDIDAKIDAMKQTDEGYLRTSMFQIKFSAIKTNKMTMKTERFSLYDDKHRLLRFTEKIDRNGEKQTVVCKPLREGNIDEVSQKEIGYKTDVILLACDNDSQIKMQSKLEKSAIQGIANFTTKKNFIMEYDNRRYKIEETTKMSIDIHGEIKKISSEVKAKDLFSIKYRTKNISQVQ